MFKRIFLGMVSFVSVLVLTVSSCFGEEVYLHSRFRQIVSFDKWVLTEGMNQMKAFVMPWNISQPVNHQVDVSFHGGVLLSGSKRNTYRVQSAAVEQGVEVSCGLDVSNGVTIGSTGTIQPTIGIQSNVNLQTGGGISLPFQVNGGLTGGANFPGELGVTSQFGIAPGGVIPFTGQIAAHVDPGFKQGWNPNIAANGGFSQGIVPQGQFTFGAGVTPQAMLTGTLTPSIQTTILPGKISKIPIIGGYMSYSASVVDVREETISLGGCLGPATMRVYLTFLVKTDRSYNKLTLHSDVVRF